MLDSSPGSLPLQRREQDDMNMNHLLSVRLISKKFVTFFLSRLKENEQRKEILSFGRNRVVSFNFDSVFRFGLLPSF